MVKEDRMERTKNRTLLIRNVQFSDSSDSYKCEVELSRDNKKGVTHSLTVQSERVQNEKIILTPSRHVEVLEGEKVTLGCEYKGEATAIKLGWFRKVRF